MKQFFVKPTKNSEARGPFTNQQIAQLAKDGKLLPHHLISVDGEKWTTAEKVKGLEFRPPDDEYLLKPLDPPPSASQQTFSKSPSPQAPPHGFQQPASPQLGRPNPAAATQATAPNETSFLRIRNQQTGGMLGALFGLGLFISSCVLSWIISAVIGDSGGIVVIIGCGLAVIAGFAIIAAFLFGTDQSLWLQPIAPHRYELTASWRVAFVPHRVVKATLSDNAQFVMFVRSAADTPQATDLYFFLLLSALCCIGVIPAIVFLIFWHTSTREEQASSSIRLILYTREQQKSGKDTITLFRRIVNDYYGTSYGTPQEIDQIHSLFKEKFDIPLIVDEE